MNMKSKHGDSGNACLINEGSEQERGSNIRPQSTAVRPLFAICRLLISVLMLLAVLWSVQVMSSAWIRALGDRAKAGENRATAEKCYRISAKIDPHNWRAHLGLGQLLHNAEYYEIDPVRKKELAGQERDAYLRAYRHNSKKEEVVYGLGRAELVLGNREAGIQYLRQAAHYKRFNDFYWRKLGIELRKEGLYEEAMETFLYAQKIDRGNRTDKRNIEWLKARAGD